MRVSISKHKRLGGLYHLIVRRYPHMCSWDYEGMSLRIKRE